MADGQGNVACFPERECSIQRRNQKVDKGVKDMEGSLGRWGAVGEAP